MKYLDKTASLTGEESEVICAKGTEYPHTGKYNATDSSGTYLCRRCGLALFRADSKFSSGCGWPSFDVCIPGAVAEVPDQDQIRTEIVCTRCQAHLGHVFSGEGFTQKNRRFCVNSLSLDFVENMQVEDTKEAMVAGGCFWGVEHYLKQVPGVLKTEVGYTGGSVVNPTYNQICNGNTGHYEAVRVIFDSNVTDYETILKNFFEIHDPTQSNGQGPDIGQQYQSVIFYYDDEQLAIAKQLKQLLMNRGYDVATRIIPVSPFWTAEDYHQDYYNKEQKNPYCHQRVLRFG